MQIEAAMRRTRRDKGIRLMSSRDRWVLRWIADQYAVRFDHLQALLNRDQRPRNPACAPGPDGLTVSRVLQVIRRWGREPEWIEYRRFHTDAPGWVWLTSYAQQQVLGLPYGRHILKESTLDHMHWINCVRLDVERRHPEYIWTSERAIRAEPRRFPSRERDEAESGGHVPDARVWTGQRNIAIEVELSPKSDQEIDDVFEALLQDDGGGRGYQRVWYFVSNATPVNVQARRVVEEARQRLPEEQRSRIQIIELEKLV
jgi:hypothetical protein